MRSFAARDVLIGMGRNDRPSRADGVRVPWADVRKHLQGGYAEIDGLDSATLCASSMRAGGGCTTMTAPRPRRGL